MQKPKATRILALISGILMLVGVGTRFLLTLNLTRLSGMAALQFGQEMAQDMEIPLSTIIPMLLPKVCILPYFAVCLFAFLYQKAKVSCSVICLIIGALTLAVYTVAEGIGSMSAVLMTVGQSAHFFVYGAQLWLSVPSQIQIFASFGCLCAACGIELFALKSSTTAGKGIP